MLWSMQQAMNAAWPHTFCTALQVVAGSQGFRGVQIEEPGACMLLPEVRHAAWALSRHRA